MRTAILTQLELSIDDPSLRQVRAGSGTVVYAVFEEMSDIR
jgi:hypothetical protein